MKFLSIEITLDEAKLSRPKILPHGKPETKEQIEKRISSLPFYPRVYTLTNKSGDKSEVDAYTREIKCLRKFIKVLNGRRYFELVLTMPNYLGSNYETEFLHFALGELGRMNELYKPAILAYKFDGNVKIIDAVGDTVKEIKADTIDRPIENSQDFFTNTGKFLKENKGLIIGGIAVLGVISLLTLLKK